MCDDKKMDNLELKAYLLKTIKNTPQLVKNKISYKNVYYNKRKEFYNIKGYIDNFLEDYDDDKFFLLPGLRGVGKTTIIFQLINYLLEEYNLKPNQILYLNLDRLKKQGNN